MILTIDNTDVHNQVIIHMIYHENHNHKGALKERVDLFSHNKRGRLTDNRRCCYFGTLFSLQDPKEIICPVCWNPTVFEPRTPDTVYIPHGAELQSGNPPYDLTDYTLPFYSECVVKRDEHHRIECYNEICPFCNQTGDLFSLAQILYFSLTGSVLHDVAIENRNPSHLPNVSNYTPVPIRSTNPETPESLARVVDQGVAKQSTDRFQKTSGFITAIESALRIL
jgi:hypothetical protein